MKKILYRITKFKKFTYIGLFSFEKKICYNYFCKYEIKNEKILKKYNDILWTVWKYVKNKKKIPKKYIKNVIKLQN